MDCRFGPDSGQVIVYSDKFQNFYQDQFAPTQMLKFKNSIIG